MSLVADLALYLENEGIGTRTTDIFANFMPDSPDTLTALYESPGLPPADVFGELEPAYDLPNLQVRVRAGPRDYAAAYTLATSVWKSLHEIVNETIDGTRYLRVAKENGPAPLPPDSDNRVLLVMNFTVTKET